MKYRACVDQTQTDPDNTLSALKNHHAGSVTHPQLDISDP